MGKDVVQGDELAPEIQDIMRNLVSAIRAVKIYPPNNPVYAQSVSKSHVVLARYLSGAGFRLGVQKTHFTYEDTPLGRDAQLNKAIAQDLFAKGIREIIITEGVTQGELLELLRALALSPEELAIKNGISSILWEKGVDHIKVAEAGLDDVITTKTEGALPERPAIPATTTQSEPRSDGNEPRAAGRTLVLGDLMTDPAAFGSSMVALAKQTRAENESIEDRLYSLYLDAGRRIQQEQGEKSDDLFNGLARSALSLESPFCDRLIAGKLYGEMDAESVRESQPEIEEHVPNELHEILTGRFSTTWNENQVASLLKKSSAKVRVPPPPPLSPAAMEAMPISRDLAELAREMSEYTPEEMDVLKIMGEAGMESDIIEAAVRTLIFLMPLVKAPNQPVQEREIKYFSGIVRQLEDLQSFLVKNRDYDLAGLILQAFQMPVDPEYRPRLSEALKKSASRTALTSVIFDMKRQTSGSPEYLAASSYLSLQERQATELMLELLAEETDRATRNFLLDLLKEFGKRQILLIGERLSDERWYFVRNIVNILSESKTEEALSFLQKAANHQNPRIREEVIKGLTSIGGKKAAAVLSKFLADKAVDIQLMAIRGLAELKGVGTEEARPLLEFLEHRPLREKEQERTIEAIKAVAKLGGPEAEQVLEGYTRVRWWRSRTLQLERRSAAQRAIAEIKRRAGDGGRARR